MPVPLWTCFSCLSLTHTLSSSLSLCNFSILLPLKVISLMRLLCSNVKLCSLFMYGPFPSPLFITTTVLCYYNSTSTCNTQSLSLHFLSSFADCSLHKSFTTLFVLLSLSLSLSLVLSYPLLHRNPVHTYTCT